MGECRKRASPFAPRKLPIADGKETAFPRGQIRKRALAPRKISATYFGQAVSVAHFLLGAKLMRETSRAKHNLPDVFSHFWLDALSPPGREGNG